MCIRDSAKGADPTSMGPITTTNFDSFCAFVLFALLAGLCMGLSMSNFVASTRGRERPQTVGHLSSTHGPSAQSATHAISDKRHYFDPPTSVYQRPKRAVRKFDSEDLNQCVYITFAYSKVYHKRGIGRSIKSLLRHFRICEFCHHDD
eukprot:2803679-Pyramimonas_sp.AAC.1